MITCLVHKQLLYKFYFPVGILALLLPGAKTIGQCLANPGQLSSLSKHSLSSELAINIVVRFVPVKRKIRVFQFFSAAQFSLEFFRQGRDNLKGITHDAVVGNIKDGGILIFVDGDNRSGGAHPHQVLDSA